MRFSANRKQLLEALKAVKLAIPSNDPKPALSHVSIEVDKEMRVILKGTDLETSIAAFVGDAIGKEAGVALCEARELLRFLKAVEAEWIHVDAPNRAPVAVVVETAEGVPPASAPAPIPLCPMQVEAAEGGLCHLSRMDEEEYPILLTERARLDIAVKLSGLELGTMIRRTLSAMAPHAGRFAMDGLRFELDAAPEPQNPALEIIGTDGRRLAVASSRVHESTEHGDGARVLRSSMPRRACEILERLLPKKAPKGGESATVRVALGHEDPDGVTVRGMFRVDIGRVRVISRALAGEFPEFRRVIPNLPLENRCTLPVEEALQRVKVAQVACASEAKALHVQFVSTGVRFEGRSLRGKSCAVVKGARGMTKSSDAGTAINPEYLSDMLTACGAEEIDFGWRDAKSPMRFDTDGFVGIVMPITLEA